LRCRFKAVPAPPVRPSAPLARSARIERSGMSEGHYDAVIVGSGFGGSVTGYRLAEAGMSVCIFERGKAYPPGSFARSPWQIARNFWDPSEGMHGIFDVWSFRGLGGIVASGLGGGSLVYSNVVLRKDEATFVKEDLEHGGYEYWPVTYADLEPHYERHERMLGVSPYPFDQPPYDQTFKTRAMQHASGQLGLQWFLPPLALAYARPGEAPGEPVHDDPPNLHGRTRLTCRLCGECNVGCNYGSKNTLDFNYLSRASLDHGATIRTRCEVKSLAPREGGGFTIDFVDHRVAVEGEKRERPQELHRVTADRLVLAAGVFGTTYLLLKNRQAFPALSDRIGTRFCGNGDILMLAMEATEDGGRPRIVDPGYGPVITSTIRVKDELEGGPGRAYYIQDGGHPQIVNWLIESAWQLGILRRLLRFAWGLVRIWLRWTSRSEVGREVAALFGPAKLSSTSLPLFSMGRDIPDGKMKLTKDGYLDVDWTTRKSNVFFNGVRKTGKDVSRVLGADFLDNLPWYLSRSVTVHPLGGCPMGRDEREGVVDSYGRVFNYPGLVIADGSTMPGPVGPNPSNTIAALAHRAADQIIAEAR
jgi:cholesterol oxidase